MSFIYICLLQLAPLSMIISMHIMFQTKRAPPWPMLGTDLATAIRSSFRTLRNPALFTTSVSSVLTHQQQPEEDRQKKDSLYFLFLCEKFTNGCKVAHLGHCIILLLNSNVLSVVYSRRARSLKCQWVIGMLMNCFWWSWHVVECFSEH